MRKVFLAREIASGGGEGAGGRLSGGEVTVQAGNELPGGVRVDGPAAGDDAMDTGIEERAGEAFGIDGAGLFADAGGASREDGEAAAGPGDAAKTPGFERVAGSEEEPAVAPVREAVASEVEDLGLRGLGTEVGERGVASVKDAGLGEEPGDVETLFTGGLEGREERAQLGGQGRRGENQRARIAAKRRVAFRTPVGQSVDDGGGCAGSKEKSPGESREFAIGFEQENAIRVELSLPRFNQGGAHERGVGFQAGQRGTAIADGAKQIADRGA